MTVSATTRKARFLGNGATTAFPFSFKVFAASDLALTLTDAAGSETALTLGSHYAVSLNADQDNNPGGTITYPITGAPLAIGETLVGLGNVDATQGLDLTNLGRFVPQVVENAFDRIFMIAQQLQEKVGRALLAPATDSTAPGQLPAKAALVGKFLAFDAGGNPIASSGTGADAGLRTDLAAPDGARLTGFQQGGTGAATRDVRSKLREVSVSGQDFGSVVVGGVTDNRLVLQAALDAAASTPRLGRREVVIYGDGDIGLAASLVVPSNVRLVFDGDARLIPTVGSIFGLNVLGTLPAGYTALAADAGRGTNTLQLASTAAFAIGDDVFVRASTLLPIAATILSQTVSPVKSVGQWAKVVGKTSTLLYLDIALEYDYLVAATAEVGIGAMKRNVRIENFKWGRLGNATLGGRAINIGYVRSLSITDLLVENTRAIGGADNAAQHGINMVSALDATIERFVMRQIGYYGIGVDGASANVRITSGRVHAARHAVSLVNGDNYGEPLDVTVENVISENSTLSGFDTHEYGDRTLFRNCVARNSNDDGFQIRSRGVTIEGGGAFKSFLDGIGAQDGATDLVVMAGFTADSNRRRGITLEIPARIQGSKLTRNGTGGVSGSGGMFCRGGELVNVQISDNNGPGINFGNAGDAAAGLLPSRLRIEGGRVPHSVAQDLAITISGDDEYLTSYISLKNTEMVGYTSGAIQKRKGTSTGGTLPAAPRMASIETAAGASGSAPAGTATLVAGTATVLTSAVKNYAGSLGATSALAPWRSLIQLTRVTAGGATGALSVETITDGTSFVIKSTSATDTSTVAWSIL